MLFPLDLDAQFYFTKEYNVPDASSGYCRLRFQELIKAVAQDKTNLDYYYTGGYTIGGDGEGMACANSPQGVIAKVNEKGELQWEKQISDRGYFTDIKCVYDADAALTGLILAGGIDESTDPSYRKFELLKTDPNGNKMYHKEYSDLNGVCTKVQQVVDINGNLSGFIAVGYLYHEDLNLNRIYLVRVDDDLNVLWDKEIYIEGENCEAYSVIQTTDKGYMLTGRCSNAAWVIKLSPSGAIQFQKKYTVPDGDLIGKDIVQVNVGFQNRYFILANSIGAADNVVVFYLNGGGTLLTDVDVDLGGIDIAKGIVHLAGGSLTISATINGLPVLLNINDALTSVSYANLYYNMQEVSPVIKTSDQGYIIGGKKEDFGYPSDHRFYLIKTNSSAVIPHSGPSNNNQCEHLVLTAAYASLGLQEDDTRALLATVPDPIDITAVVDLALEEQYICGEMCSDVIPTSMMITKYICATVTQVTLTADCPPGTDHFSWSTSSDPTGIYSSDPTIDVWIFSEDYILRCYNKYGCVLSETIYHFEYASYTPVEYGWNYCAGDVVTFPDPCVAPNSAVWSPAGPVVTITTNQTYTVNCVNEYGCVVSSTLHHVFVNPCGPNGSNTGTTNNAEISRNVQIAPNPSTGAIKLSLNLGDNETYQVRVIDMLGKEVMLVNDARESQLSLDVSELPAGIYHVEIQIGGDVIRKKLVRQ